MSLNDILVNKIIYYHTYTRMIGSSLSRGEGGTDPKSPKTHRQNVDAAEQYAEIEAVRARHESEFEAFIRGEMDDEETRLSSAEHHEAEKQELLKHNKNDDEYRHQFIPYYG